MELCALGLLLIPSVTLTASFAPKERVLHSWGNVFPIFRLPRVLFSTHGRQYFPFRSRRVLGGVLGNVSSIMMKTTMTE